MNSSSQKKKAKHLTKLAHMFTAALLSTSLISDEMVQPEQFPNGRPGREAEVRTFRQDTPQQAPF